MGIYKTGVWGKQAKERSKRRIEYFIQYRKEHPQEYIERETYGEKKKRLKYIGAKYEFQKGHTLTQKENNWNWKGGITPLRNEIRNCRKYKQWRSDVFQRDNWICQTCGERGNRLIGHHIVDFSDIMERNEIITYEQALRCEEFWDINNGVTLCKECHDLTRGRK